MTLKASKQAANALVVKEGPLFVFFFLLFSPIPSEQAKKKYLENHIFFKLKYKFSFSPLFLWSATFLLKE
jgi:hypothetical protein